MHDEPAPILPAPALPVGIADLPIGNGFSLPALLEMVARSYLEKAIEQADGSKKAAAQLVGLPSYQTFSNWAVRYKAQPTRLASRVGSAPAHPGAFSSAQAASKRTVKAEFVRPKPTSFEL
jgi:hypothetical protein